MQLLEGHAVYLQVYADVLHFTFFLVPCGLIGGGLLNVFYRSVRVPGRQLQCSHGHLGQPQGALWCALRWIAGTIELHPLLLILSASLPIEVVGMVLCDPVVTVALYVLQCRTLPYRA